MKGFKIFLLILFLLASTSIIVAFAFPDGFINEPTEDEYNLSLSDDELIF